MYVIIEDTPDGAHEVRGYFATRIAAEQYLDALNPGKYDLLLTVDHFTVTHEAGCRCESCMVHI